MFFTRLSASLLKNVRTDFDEFLEGWGVAQDKIDKILDSWIRIQKFLKGFFISSVTVMIPIDS